MDPRKKPAKPNNTTVNVTDCPSPVDLGECGVVTSRDVLMTSRGVLMTSRGVLMTSRGVLMKSQCSAMNGAML